MDRKKGCLFFPNQLSSLGTDAVQIVLSSFGKGMQVFRENGPRDIEPDQCSGALAEGWSNFRAASFFAGIGGFDRALELEKASIVFQCEKDKFCRSVLSRHWPQAKISEDIRSLTASEIPDAEVWTAGFPCQDVSLARGNHGRNGLTGNHTSLFFALTDLLKAKKPEVVLLENVVGLLNSHRGQDFAVILRELTSLGYAVSWRVMNARYFGDPQSRPRVFLCAWRGNPVRALRTLYEDVPGTSPGPERAAFLMEETHQTGAIVAKIAYCVSATSGRHTGLDWARSYVSYEDRVRRPTPTESERLQGFPTNWTIPGPDYKPSPRGLDSERYKAAGNAVAVPVVHWIAKRLVAQLGKRSRNGTEGKLDTASLKCAPDLQVEANWLDSAQIKGDLNAGQFIHRWKPGGCAFGSKIVEGRAPPAPSAIIEARFVEALDPAIPDERYFLTSNAAAGILRRVDAEKRKLFSPMRRALEILVK
jgi:DNA (cytosine-5)-methyltransferase 1